MEKDNGRLPVIPMDIWLPNYLGSLYYRLLLGSWYSKRGSKIFYWIIKSAIYCCDVYLHFKFNICYYGAYW